MTWPHGVYETAAAEVVMVLYNVHGTAAAEVVIRLNNVYKTVATEVVIWPQCVCGWRLLQPQM